MDDLLKEASDATDMLDTVASTAAPRQQQYGAAKEPSNWDRTDFKAVEIDVTKFELGNKNFVIYAYPENDIPETATKTLTSVADALMKREYTFRSTGDAKNELQNAIAGLENTRIDAYLPWKKFNAGVTDPIMPKEYGYQVAIGIHKAFVKLPPAVRTILARDVSAMLGVDGTKPVDFILAWSDGGDEALTRTSDFKRIGNNSFILQVAKRANIPVFNVYNTDFIERFSKVLKK